MPGLTLGDTIPDLEVDTTHGRLRFYDYIGDGWLILFSHPVCTTELGKIAEYADKFAGRGVKLLRLSCDDLHSHREWIKDIEAYNVQILIVDLIQPNLAPRCSTLDGLPVLFFIMGMQQLQMSIHLTQRKYDVLCYNHTRNRDSKRSACKGIFKDMEGLWQ
ncbi:hypothetical protein RHGRI_004206 [Rhododendron griersonianum]|uniref:Alkyl hydroperoxide reductase subunit C/ Thiol specific antioxidant domain-containing protein n=1 Tax=Rhododendron griersonianum TaxID=479676 RepID=A0AAV6L7T7_9ERIC|nr:hypothetical protein RHGRI_004206 [Rhododendron griersonianum]KAG5561111.1 hypothetical protein RHGRI_004206 [Rhododendron griersonianum]KAG5561113.1 hypothetical protein RHGRI_004206 [Rhododendron griersonianum]KAG5561114.1 hypothetical protein RHGRI_004206 [Rhododendron griersonianum]KAG5561115.1 hypothetical protein RHGRI_004206 [Rhododendron griersonianum]